jgi:hypothetical protein
LIKEFYRLRNNSGLDLEVIIKRYRFALFPKYPTGSTKTKKVASYQGPAQADSSYAKVIHAALLPCDLHLLEDLSEI